MVKMVLTTHNLSLIQAMMKEKTEFFWRIEDIYLILQPKT